MDAPRFVHPTAEVHPSAEIGPGTAVWRGTHVRERARLGRECILGEHVYIDAGVRVGDRVKIQNGVSVFAGVELEDGVFCGPHVVFTNDLRPRAVTPEGQLKSGADWTVTPTLVREGAALGANSTIVCGVTIGRWAVVGAGSVVTRDVPDHALVLGNPARQRGWICACGDDLTPRRTGPAELRCGSCGREVAIA